MNMEKEDILFATTGTVNHAEGFGKNAGIPYIRTLTPQEGNVAGEKAAVPITRRRTEVPIWEKATLTLEEAAEYSNIGLHKLRELTDAKNCRFVIWNGNKRLIKRRLFDSFLESAYSI